MRFFTTGLLLCIGCLPASALAQPKASAPRLIVAVSVDQFSGDLFTEYRSRFSQGMKRLLDGVVFPNGYQSHAATETCPGHATILTGSYPSRTGIIANYWLDYRAPRTDKQVYCVEDESAAGTDHDQYVPSLVHLRTPTLGDRLKAVSPRSRVVSVAGKDRSALLMGGHAIDQTWFWQDDRFATLPGRTANAAADRINKDLAARIARGLPAPKLPAFCQGRPGLSEALPGAGEAPVTLAALKPGDTASMPLRIELNEATTDLAIALSDQMALGQGEMPDMLTIGLSATDYTGHAYGTEGAEMCAQVMALDGMIKRLFDHLEAKGVPYMFVLTADHGGHDLAERNKQHGIPDDTRYDLTYGLASLNAAMGYADQPVFRGDDPRYPIIFGNLYLDHSITGSERSTLIERAKAWLKAQPIFADAFTRSELLVAKPPKAPPETWTLLERAAASVDAERSGDLVALLAPRVSPIPAPEQYGARATHGSPWDYDRRVPILFYGTGLKGFEQPNSIEVVDIMPTLASLIDLPVPAEEIDGRCRDILRGQASNCPTAR